MAEGTTTHLALPYPTSAGEVKNGATNIKELAEKVDEVLYEHRFGGFASSIIAAEQATASTTFTKLATPDEVSVALPTNGLLLIGYQAAWKSSTAGKKVSAAVFLGSNQLVIAAGVSSPVAQEAAHTQGTLQSLSGTTVGLATHESGTYGADATTGQIISPGAAVGGGLMAVFAAAGTYAVSVQFKVESGAEVKAVNRKLWAWVVA